MTMDELSAFIVRAKSHTYAADGERATSSRLGSHDLVWREGDWTYRDSYFGGTDFLGREIVWSSGEPVWGMNYFGYVLRPDLIDAARAGATIKAALSALYSEGRFLGGFEWSGPHGRYVDRPEGSFERFTGRELILVDEVEVYRLDYAGGRILE